MKIYHAAARRREKYYTKQFSKVGKSADLINLDVLEDLVGSCLPWNIVNWSTKSRAQEVITTGTLKKKTSDFEVPTDNIALKCTGPWGISRWRCHRTSLEIPIIKIGQYNDSLIFIMGILIPDKLKTVFIIETWALVGIFDDHI